MKYAFQACSSAASALAVPLGVQLLVGDEGAGFSGWVPLAGVEAFLLICLIVMAVLRGDRYLESLFQVLGIAASALAVPLGVQLLVGDEGAGFSGWMPLTGVEAFLLICLAVLAACRATFSAERNNTPKAPA
ncbi:hypothetical protein SAMN05421595_1997 [Austwickia chelonae]|uniref:Uncharacterized protein n=1 Tax=Austwickia chelonae NBRC 105200 TaxID=1184607 RepID=K6V400_9MICO|nr:hypothetical protein [Austwickia chelonae]GAB76863.1 hypothetical protein AUCHE_03_00800 [Austwickia chelonae NBRC 105200]SEW31711.1 hypothetical protein SAMN05421595_1997 [Austwickia chelonae]